MYQRFSSMMLLIAGAFVVIVGPVSSTVGESLSEFRPEAGSSHNLHSVSKRQAAPFGTSIFFKYRWVSQCGYGSLYSPDQQSIQVSSTLTVPDAILDKAARLVYLMTRFMPSSLFQSLSQNISVGVFTHRQDKPSTFPEYTDRADRPECSGRCDADCSQTCIEDGAKFDDQWIYSGPRILVAAQNLDCDRNLFNDPQFGLLNLLVSEIAKITGKRLSSGTSQLLYQSYQNALDVPLWTSSTAMSSVSDYFIQGSLAWFISTRLTDPTTGGLNICGEKVCATEIEARKRIADVDHGLYQVLNDVYNNGRDYIQGGITVCRW